MRALDAADRFRDLLATQELLTATKGTGTLHVNPLWRAQTEAIETFTRLARLLGLQWDPEVDGHEVASVYEAPDYGRAASHLAPRRPGPGNGHEADEARTSHDAPTGGDNTHEDPAAASDRAPVNLTSLCRRCHDNETGREGQAAR